MTQEQHDRIEAILEMVKKGSISIPFAMADITRILHKQPKCEFVSYCTDWVVGLRCQSWCSELMRNKFKENTEDK